MQKQILHKVETKQRILISAKTIFNRFGFTQMGMRAIAKESGLSLGNLTYHFAKKEDIVWALYLELTERINLSLDLENNAPIDAALKSLYNYYHALYEYRFFMLELVYFMEHFKNINQHFTALEKEREKQITELLFILRSNGLMFYETVAGYDQLLIDQWTLHGNFWLSQMAVKNQKLNPEIVLKGMWEVYSILLPQLTLIGKKNFQLSLNAYNFPQTTSNI